MSDQSSSNGYLSTERVKAMSDGMFAIVMTLLVLELKVPENDNITQLFPALWALRPYFFSYVISFLMLGVYWVGHHNQYHYIKYTDRILLWINLSFLFFVSILPFSTSLMSRYHTIQLPYMIYGLNLIAIGMIAYLHWCYATTHHRLTDHDVNKKIITAVKRRVLVAPIICIFAIVLSFFATDISLILYLLIPPYYIWPGQIDAMWRREAVPHDD